MKSILFVSLSNLGDATLSLPALEALAAAYPNAAIDVVCGPSAVAVFAGHPRVRTLYPDVKRPFSGRVRLFFKLFGNRYDGVVDLRRSMFALLSRKRGISWGERVSHKRDQHLDAVRALGINVEPFRFTGSRSVGPGLLSGSTAVIAPGSKSSTKEWMPERFAALAERLILQDGLEVLWIGDERERERIDAIRARMTRPSVNLAGKLSWPETLEAIRAAAIVITNDSAPLHAADHLGKKTVAIFGPTNPERYGPQRSSSGIVFKGIECSPCEQAQCRYGHRRCLVDITVEDVYRRAKSLLEDAPEREGPRVLVVRLDRLGDVSLSFAAVTAIRKKFPAARIAWLVRPSTREMAERCPDSDEAIEYDYSRTGRHRGWLGALRLARQLRRRRFDMAFVLNPSLRSHLLTALSGAPYRAGYGARGDWLLTHRILDLRREGYQHESRYVQDVVRALGVPATDEIPEMVLYADDFAAAKKLLEEAGWGDGRPFAILHATASSSNKCWSREYFAELGRRLAQEFGWKIALVGDASATSINGWLAGQIPGALDLSGRTSLSVLAALSRSAQIVISNDSGPAHLAAVAGARVLSLFGRKQKGIADRRWAPFGPHASVLRKDVGCVVCLADQCPIEFECMRALSPAEVFDAVKTQVETFKLQRV